MSPAVIVPHVNGPDPVLTEAILTARPERVRKILISLIGSNDHAAALASFELLADTKQVRLKRGRDEEETTAERLGVTPKKCKRYEQCVQCDQEYDVLTNTDRSCTWHPGQTEVDDDSDVWADHDVRIHGEYEDCFDDCPEGFIWDCCAKPGTKTYCKIGPHSSVQADSGIDADSEEELEDEEDSEDE